MAIFGILAVVSGLTGGIEKLFIKPEPSKVIIRSKVPAGATFISFMTGQGFSTGTASEILAAAKPVYDFATIIAGREAIFQYDHTGAIFEKLIYKIDTERQLTIWVATSSPDGANLTAQVLEAEEGLVSPPSHAYRQAGLPAAVGWLVEVADIPYEVKISEASGTIETSLYETMVGSGFDQRLALAVAEVFAWQVDFAADIRSGDSFKVIHEDRYLDGEYAMPGRILAAQFINDGETFNGYLFEGPNTKIGYYDEKGKSLQKIFLKSPLQYKYISSGYTGARLNPITKKVSPHRGIDYVANTGTPAVSVGDGTVTQAGWNGYYGLSVTVRHNDTYTTRYGHFSALPKGIRKGAHVKQGQVVGYVGSTGLSTGPHLHYEMHKFGSYVNPFKVEVPPTEDINEQDRSLLEALTASFTL
ncbi:MAG: metalloendopeptidase-like membrane protein [Parcubacteria group bacterium Gr01-1014_3]|nr:MAG: metalloendopeptidase-like membrane protein [Parcubacteria group bacterium Gr01-1014_3]